MKKALITGANKGIGFETARQLLLNGYYVYIGCRNVENGLQAIEKLKDENLTNVEVLQIDVTNDDSVSNARIELGTKTEILDVLVNNAGINGGEPFGTLEATSEQILSVFNTNVFGVARVTKAFIDMLRKSAEPRIVNVSTAMASLTLAADTISPSYNYKLAVYQSSKAALNMYTIALNQELQNTAFKINMVCPGYTQTDFTSHQGTSTPEQAGKRIAKYAMIDQNGPTGKFISEEYFPEPASCPW
jgi:NAD(P)-dependent dehydrogenase (short-subunit alcohol dehydrogenase family)